MATKYEWEKYNDNRIHQGDIFKNMPFYESYSEIQGEFSLSVIEFPLAIILTQECDLKQNFIERIENKKQDKYLVSLLCAPLYNAQHLFSGENLSELNVTTEKKNSEQKNYIKSNRDARYHYIELAEETEIPPIIIDFKHYFSISLYYLESKFENRICSISPIFRESISQRFSHYLSRIGLPEK